jgi:hypothetical protein
MDDTTRYFPRMHLCRLSRAACERLGIPDTPVEAVLVGGNDPHVRSVHQNGVRVGGLVSIDDVTVIEAPRG